MTLTQWRDLALLSVKDPAVGARAVLSLNLPRQVSWMGLVLVSAISTLLFFLSDLIAPIDAIIPVALLGPIPYFILSCGALALTTSALFFSGRWLGGTAEFDDMLALTVWLETLRAAVQVIAFVLLLIAPMISTLAALGFSFYAVYIGLQFIDQAHRLGSLLKAFVVMAVAMVVIAMALFVLVPVFGGFLGGLTNV